MVLHRGAVLAAICLIGGLAGCGAGRPAPSASSPTNRPPAASASVPGGTPGLPAAPRPGTPPPGAAEERHPTAGGIGPARPAATAFFRSYVAYEYGRLSGARVLDVDPEVRLTLTRGRACITPAERRADVRVVRVSVTPAGPPASAVASATVEIGGVPGPRLTATLEPRDGTWIVVAIGG